MSISQINSLQHNFLLHVAGLRALAIIFVVLFHLDGTAWAQGYLGVDVFLVITGFLLFRGYIASYDKEKSLSIVGGANFIWRKASRIVPPMVFIIFITVVIGMFFMWNKDELFLCKLGSNALRCKANIFLASEFKNYFAQESAFVPLLHMWYLSVTLQIYAIWAVGVQCLQRLPKNLIISVLCIIGAISLFYCYSFPIHTWLKQMGMPTWEQAQSVSYYQTLPRLWEVLAGGLVYCLPLWGHKRIWPTIATVLGLLGIILPGFGLFTEAPCTLLVVVSTILIIRYTPESYLNPILSNKLCVWIGGISFSIYLVHMPIFIFWNLWLFGNVDIWDKVLMALVVIPVGWAYWWAVEKRKFNWWQIGIMWGMAMLLCTAGKNTWGFNRFFKQAALSMPSYKEWSFYKDEKLKEGLTKDIEGFASLWSRLNVKSPNYKSIEEKYLVSIGDRSLRPTFVLMGDSIAACQYAGIDNECRRYQISGVYLSTVVIPFHNYNFTLNEHYKFHPQKEDVIFQWLEKHKELKYVIITNYWNARIKEHPKYGATNDYTNDMKEFLQRLIKIGKVPIVIGPTPTSHKSSFDHYYKIINARAKTIRELDVGCPLKEHIITHHKAYELLDKLSAERLCHVIKVTDALKLNERFYCTDGKSELYMADSVHITTSFSIFLWKRLFPRLKEIIHTESSRNNS